MSTCADYYITIGGAFSGSIQLQVTDENGVEVLNVTLTGGTGVSDDSGLTSSGTSGTWTVTITLTDFGGTGDFSLNPSGC